MKSIEYIKGNLFTEIKNRTNIIIPHVCNCKGVMGAGFVVPLRKEFPVVFNSYKNGSLELGSTQLVKVSDISNVFVANMIAQTLDKDFRPLYYNHLVECMKHVQEYCTNQTCKLDIHCPKFGAGLAGGKWEFIEELIIDCWIRKNLNVTVYYL